MPTRDPKECGKEPLSLALGEAGARVAEEEQACPEGKLWPREFFLASAKRYRF